jgi:colanic acid/amylovoran biosynthesis protein
MDNSQPSPWATIRHLLARACSLPAKLRCEPRPERFLVISSGGARNQGDDAILLSTLQRLKRIRPGCVPVVFSDGTCPPALARLGLWGGRVGELAGSLEPESIQKGCRGHPDLLRDLVQRLGQCSSRPLSNWKLTSFDAVIICGGGYWTHYWPYVPARRTVIAAAALGAGVPYLVSGQGIGPLTQDLVPLLQFFAAGAQRFAVRDPLSARFLAGHCPNVQAQVLGDDALGLAEAEPGRVDSFLARAGVSGGAKLLGFQVREDADYVGFSRHELMAIARRVDDLAARTGRAVLCLPINSQPPTPEFELLVHLSRGIQRRASWFFADCREDVASLATLLGRCEAVVTQSYHVGLFALSHRVPTIMQARTEYYRRKVAGLREFFRIPVDITLSEEADGAALDRQLRAIADTSWSPKSTSLAIDAWLDQALKASATKLAA